MRRDCVEEGHHVIANLHLNSFPRIPPQSDTAFGPWNEPTPAAIAAGADGAIREFVLGVGLCEVDIERAFKLARESEAADRRAAEKTVMSPTSVHAVHTVGNHVAVN